MGQSTQPTTTAEPKLEFLFIGGQDTGKSCFYYNQTSLEHRESHEIGKCCSKIVLNIVKTMSKNERTELASTFNKVNEMLVDETVNPFATSVIKLPRDCLLKLWKTNRFFREYYDEHRFDHHISINQNLKLLFEWYEKKILFNPLIFDSLTPRSWRSLELLDSQDRRNIKLYDCNGKVAYRYMWNMAFSVDTVRTVVVFASLTEFDQNMEECGEKNRMDDSLDIYENACKETSAGCCRVILILTKPDLLIEKLRCGKKYSRKLNYGIRSELDYLPNYFQVKLIVNSIVREFEERNQRIEETERGPFEYHIVNVLDRSQCKHFLSNYLLNIPIPERHFFSLSLSTFDKQHFLGQFLYATQQTSHLCDIQLFTD